MRWRGCLTCRRLARTGARTRTSAPSSAAPAPTARSPARPLRHLHAAALDRQALVEQRLEPLEVLDPGLVYAAARCRWISIAKCGAMRHAQPRVIRQRHDLEHLRDAADARRVGLDEVDAAVADQLGVLGHAGQHLARRCCRRPACWSGDRDQKLWTMNDFVIPTSRSRTRLPPGNRGAGRALNREPSDLVTRPQSARASPARGAPAARRCPCGRSDR